VWCVLLAHRRAAMLPLCEGGVNRARRSGPMELDRQSGRRTAKNCARQSGIDHGKRDTKRAISRRRKHHAPTHRSDPARAITSLTCMEAHTNIFR
jgi:hypothetical protein